MLQSNDSVADESDHGAGLNLQMAPAETGACSAMYERVSTSEQPI